jgi:hypothetical protein
MVLFLAHKLREGTALIFDIFFELDPVLFVALLKHVPKMCSAYNALTKGEILHRVNARVPGTLVYQIRCNETDYELFLAMAQQYCPKAVVQIQDARAKPHEQLLN